MGQVDAALLGAPDPRVDQLPKGAPRARLQYAYADLLERAGRFDESRESMRKAAASDIGGVTDAEERVAEEEGLAFSEEEPSLTRACSPRMRTGISRSGAHFCAPVEPADDAVDVRADSGQLVELQHTGLVS